jgi:hypothetical protein
MKIKQLTTNHLIVQIKGINWIGVGGCLMILFGLSYKLKIDIVENKDFSFLVIFILFSFFLLVAVQVTLTKKLCRLDKSTNQLAISSQILFLKSVNSYALTDIVDVQVEKTNTSQDDIGSVHYNIYFYLASTKRIELGTGETEQQAQKIAQQIRDFLNF